MADEVTTDIAEIELPFGRRARLKNVAFESGLNMLRLVLREGKRITIVDMDAEAAGRLGDEIRAWAERQGGQQQGGA